MSQPGPIVVVSDDQPRNPALSLLDPKLFPVVETDSSGVMDAIARVQPAAVVAAAGPALDLQSLAQHVDRQRTYLPLIAVDPFGDVPVSAIPFHSTASNADCFTARLNAALRVRTLHATVLRRLQNTHSPLPTSDPLTDATVLLMGRGPSFPALSVAFGERIGVIGALSVEAAANHLNVRHLDGVIIGEGFSPRVIDAFITVLTEDARFRSLPVFVAGSSAATSSREAANVEAVTGAPHEIVMRALPLIRQTAFEARLYRALRSIDANGLLDSRTGLLTETALRRDLAQLVEDAHANGAGLSVASFTFADADERTSLDAARIVSRLLRRMDVASLLEDNSILVCFSGTMLRDARLIARRISSVLKQTVVSKHGAGKLTPDVTLSTLMPNDTVEALLARLVDPGHRKAS